jgi:hypothetical protein
LASGASFSVSSAARCCSAARAASLGEGCDFCDWSPLFASSPALFEESAALFASAWPFF